VGGAKRPKVAGREKLVKGKRPQTSLRKTLKKSRKLDVRGKGERDFAADGGRDGKSFTQNQKKGADIRAENGFFGGALEASTVKQKE